jgi:hypothetical protein
MSGAWIVGAIVCGAWGAIAWAAFNCPADRKFDSKSRPLAGRTDSVADQLPAADGAPARDGSVSGGAGAPLGFFGETT